MVIEKFLGALFRRKSLDDTLLDTKLQRCLSTLDLSLLGVGLMIGAGIYALTGTVIRTEAGPAAILSYLLAGVAALFSSLCYAEFGARVPRAGSAYSYTYVTIGEFWAFFVGWNVILEYVLSVASVAIAFSGTANSLCNDCIQNWTCTHIANFETATILHRCPDLPALAIVIFLSVFVAVGVRISSGLTNAMVVVNVLVLIIIIVAGFTKANPDNILNKDHGGFMPFKFGGVLQGAATCFFAYIGFDGIGSAGEETKNPARSIPIANCISLGVAILLYMGTTSSLTLMVPFYEVDTSAPFPAAFAYVGMDWIKVVVAIGSFVGISCSLLTHSYAMPRIVYAMAQDGLIFRWLAYVNNKTQTPLLAIGVTCLAAGFMAFMFNIETLVDFLSIGTLLAFTFVAACVILLRYQHHNAAAKPTEHEPSKPYSDTTGLVDDNSGKHSQCHLKQYFMENPHFQFLQKYSTDKLTTLLVITMTTSMTLLALSLLYGIPSPNINIKIISIVVTILMGLVVGLSLAGISMHEQNVTSDTFMVPLVPFLPAVSMFLNIILILELQWLTWIRLLVWMCLGFAIYFLYGIRNSSENKPLQPTHELTSYDSNSTSDVPASAQN